MTKLTCNVGFCNSNEHEHGCCCRPEIQVTGKHAQSCGDTCCSSFSAPLDGQGENSVRSYTTPNPQLPILCTAETCRHYQNGMCHADQVSMGGAGATRAGQTECNSFVQGD